MLKNKSFLLSIFFSLALIGSVLAFFALALIPSDAKNGLMFGFSTSRLALMAVTTLVMLTLFAILIWISTSHLRMQRAIHFIDGILFDAKKQRVLAILCGIMSASGILFLLLPAERIGVSIYQRILPLVLLAAGIGLETLVFQFIYRGEKIYWEQLSKPRVVLIAGGIAMACFTAAWIAVAWSGLGIIPEKSGWLTPGTPILPQQVLFAWLIGMAFIAFGKQLDQYKKTDLVIAIVLWIIAGIVWQMEPMTRWGYFTPKPTPPNFEYYPYSDAILHDGFAQTILIGTSRQIDYTVRPLYTIFIALLHVLFGQKLETIVVVQVFILAITPAFVYLLAMKMGGRAAGILAATLVILREKNSIVVTNIIEVSHSKLLMSDLPTMTMLVIFMFFLVSWFQDSKNRLYLGALAGAFLGMAILIRSQSQLLVPVALLGIIIAKRDGWKAVTQKLMIFTFGLLVVTAPWVWRNYQVSGRAVIEYQEVYTKFFAGNYAFSKQEIEMLPNETVKEYDSRMSALIVHNLLSKPQKFGLKFLSYTIYDEVLSLTYLPITFQFKDIYTYIDGTTFWTAPKEPMPVRTLPMLFLTLCIIAAGVGAAFQRAGWIGIAPLFLHIAYNISATFIFASGWRFIQPVDWVSLLYFSIGLIQISTIVFSLFTGKYDDPTSFNAGYTSITWEKTFTTLALFAAFGVSLPLFEWSFPEIYPAMETKALIQKYVPDGITQPEGGVISIADVESFLKTESQAMVVHGRALYPAYYKQGQSWGDAPYLAEARQLNRLEFMLISTNARRDPVYFSMEAAPEYFPHASSVFIIGCELPNAIRALIIKVDDRIITASPWNGLTCETK